MFNTTGQACSYCGCLGDDDEVFTTGDSDDPYICIDCVEKAEERRSLDLAETCHRTRLL